MHVIVICKFYEDPTKNEEATLFTRSIMATFENQGDVTLPLLVRSNPFSNSSEILSMSFLSASFMKVLQKVKKLRCSQAFSHSKPMGPISCHSNQSSEAIFLYTCKQSPTKDMLQIILR